jgi:hypothetical protein
MHDGISDDTGDFPHRFWKIIHTKETNNLKIITQINCYPQDSLESNYDRNSKYI